VVTSQPNKIKCDPSTATCDQTEVDISEPGPLSYKIQPIGGPGNIGKESM
jgi:hypothetical protein